MAETTVYEGDLPPMITLDIYRGDTFTFSQQIGNEDPDTGVFTADNLSAASIRFTARRIDTDAVLIEKSTSGGGITVHVSPITGIAENGWFTVTVPAAETALLPKHISIKGDAEITYSGGVVYTPVSFTGLIVEDQSR